MTSKLRNIGPKSALLLENVGILTPQDLLALGSEEAFRRAKIADPSVSLNLLWALEGACDDIDWRHIDPARKRQLQRNLKDVLK